MRGYHISIGYNGGGTSQEEEVRWRSLVAMARRVADYPELIVEEARRLGTPETCASGCCHLATYADNYRLPFGVDGHPVSVIESSDNRQIMQLASGYDDLKFGVRRAFVRLLLAEMHRIGVEVNLRVA